MLHAHLKYLIMRIASGGWNVAEGDDCLEVYHSWLTEKLDDDHVRILTQEI